MHWLFELVKEALLFLGLDHMKDMIAKGGAGLVKNGVQRYQRRMKEIGEWRHELIGFVHTELPSTLRVRFMDHWRRIERHDHKTYPDRVNFSNNERYEPGDEAIFTLVMTDHFRFLSGDEADEEGVKKTKPADLIRGMKSDEKETRRKSFELIASQTDELRDALVLVMLNDQPKQFLERLRDFASAHGTEPAADGIETVNTSLFGMVNALRRRLGHNDINPV